MTKANQEQLLRSYPVVAELPADLRRRLTREARRFQSPAGRELFDEGSPCVAYPMLVEGTIRAMKSGPDGHEILLYRLYPGETCVITVTALLGETPYPARASAETNLTLFAVPRDLFLDLVLQSPPFRTFVFKFLSERMAHLMALIDDVAFRRLDQRLASLLLRRRGPIQATHQMLADELGTTREVVSRTLEAFQESGMLRLGRKRIEVLNRTALGRVQSADGH